MASRTKTTKWTVDQIIELGLEVIGETVEYMKSVSVEDRDGEFAKSMTAFSRAACEISKEMREGAAFLAKQQIDPEMMRGLIQDYLRAMPREEFVAMVAQVRTGEQQAGAQV
jgi:hypothetical protein